MADRLARVLERLKAFPVPAAAAGNPEYESLVAERDDALEEIDRLGRERASLATADPHDTVTRRTRV